MHCCPSVIQQVCATVCKPCDSVLLQWLLNLQQRSCRCTASYVAVAIPFDVPNATALQLSATHPSPDPPNTRLGTHTHQRQTPSHSTNSCTQHLHTLASAPTHPARVLHRGMRRSSTSQQPSRKQLHVAQLCIVQQHERPMTNPIWSMSPHTHINRCSCTIAANPHTTTCNPQGRQPKNWLQ